MAIHIGRREFVFTLGGAAAMWPLPARAQQAERVRRIGVLLPAADDPVFQARLAAFQQALAGLGWSEGRNVRFEYRWGAGNAELHSQARGRNSPRSHRTSSWPTAPRPWGPC